jgi:hypothetical protein
MGSYANGIKLASELVLDQLLTQFLPGFDYTWAAFGPPFLDARRHSRPSDGVDDPRASRDAGAWPAELPQRIQNADPRHADVVEHGGVAHDQTPEVIDEGEHRHFLSIGHTCPGGPGYRVWSLPSHRRDTGDGPAIARRPRRIAARRC